MEGAVVHGMCCTMNLKLILVYMCQSTHVLVLRLIVITIIHDKVTTIGLESPGYFNTYNVQ